MPRLRFIFLAAVYVSLCAACSRTSHFEQSRAEAPSVELAASPPRVTLGAGVELRWQASHAAGCTASGQWYGRRGANGTATVGPLFEDSEFLLECSGPGGKSRAVVRVPVGTTVSSSRFPLRVAPGDRHLVDANGHPFLIQGDTAWSLIAELTRPEVEQYLNDRQARGFNTILVNLIEHRFARNPPRNAYGDGPFVTDRDFSTPNEQYFAYVDWVLKTAAQKGFLVLLVPAYLGTEGSAQGWYQEMIANGESKLRAYGRYLGQRYRGYTNILWVHGGDFNPPDRNLVNAVAEGIGEFDARALASAHCAPETAAYEFWGEHPWLTVNSVYTYRPAYQASLEQYQRPAPMPFILIETVYENEHGTTARLVRAQAYDSLLSGASGYVFGNNPIWHFGGPGLFPTIRSWKQHLGGTGSRTMSLAWRLYSSLAWWLLVPDMRQALLTSGFGPDSSRAVAAVASDRSFAVVYMPTVRDVTVNLGQLRGPLADARWFDPSNGSYTAASGSPYRTIGSQSFRPSGQNGGGDGDWVLVLTTR
jgi:hypothetical protein